MRGLTVENTQLAVKVSRSERVSGLLVPAHLAGGIVAGIAAPLRSHSGVPYSLVGGRTMSLTPWISGRTAFESGMNADQWRRFGALLSQVHAAQLPEMVADQLDTEDYRTSALAVAGDLHERICGSGGGRHLAASADPLTVALTRDWQTASDSIALVLAQTDELGDELRAGSRASVVCHGDAHLGNVMLGENGAVWLLDWDGAVLAPRERDLMFVIGGVLTKAPVTTEEQQWFFEGYGDAEIDPIQLAYYRCSWAVQDLTDFAARILDRSAGLSPARSQAP
jgi:spectinomycin phosphotransferase